MRKLLFIFLCLPLAAWACALHEVHVHDAYVRASIPGQQNSAAYMQIHNTDGNDYRLVAVVAKEARLVQMHTVDEKEGVARMRQVDYIDIPANERVNLEPGANHIMLIDLAEPLQTGQNIDFILVYNDGSRTELSVPVQDIRNRQAHDHSHH